MKNKCHNWVHIAAGNQEGRALPLWDCAHASRVSYCLCYIVCTFMLFLIMSLFKMARARCWCAAWCHWTQQGWNGAMLRAEASSHSHELACCGVSSLLIQQCVVNNASDQKCTPNKIACRTAKKQCREAQWVLTFSFPLGKWLRIHWAGVCLAFIEHSCRKHRKLSVCVWLPGF